MTRYPRPATQAISEGYRVLVLFQFLRVDSGDLRQLVEIHERTVVVAVLDDLLRLVGRQSHGVGYVGGGAPIDVHLSVVLDEVRQQDVVVVVGDRRAELGHLLERFFPLRLRAAPRDDPIRWMTLRADGLELLRAGVVGWFLRDRDGRQDAPPEQEPCARG